MFNHRACNASDAWSGASVVLVEPLEPRLMLSAALAAPAAQALSEGADSALAVFVEAVVEAESDGGGTNNAAADAQVLEFLPVFGDDAPGPLQAVVTGTADGWGGPAALYEDSSMVFGAVAAPNVYAMTMVDAFAPGTDGVVTITAKADLDAGDEFLTLTAEGVVLGDLFVNDGRNFEAVTAQVTIPAVQLAAMASDGLVELALVPSAAVEREQSGYLVAELAYAGAGGGGTADYYAVDLQAGDLLSLAADGAVSLELVDGDGTVLAAGDIGGFVAEQAGTYCVRIAGEGRYTLVATRVAVMDVEDNGTPALAQAILGPATNGRRWAVGSLAGRGGEVDRDVYRVTLSGGKRPLQVRVVLPVAGAKVAVGLYDAAGRLVAQGRQRSDGTVLLKYKAPKRAGGAYFIQVTAGAGVPIDYVLSAAW